MPLDGDTDPLATVAASPLVTFGYFLLDEKGTLLTTICRRLIRIYMTNIINIYLRSGSMLSF